MVKWVSNLPPQDAIPYPFIMAEPHVKQIFTSFRPSDYGIIAGFGTLFPAAFLAWERSKPSCHPRMIPRIMAVQIPFFLTVGTIFAAQRSLFRFWGWTENGREVKRFGSAESIAAVEAAAEFSKYGGRAKGWSDQEW